MIVSFCLCSGEIDAHPLSRSSRIVWLLEELHADHDIVYTDIPRMDGSGGSDSNNPHPDKKVPALVHYDVLITESVAITLYLTDLFPNAKIGPLAGDPDRGSFLTWLAYYAGVIEPVITFQFLGLKDHDGLASTFRGRAELDRRILDSLTNTPYLVGKNFTAVDIMVASMGQWARDMLPEGGTIDAYLQRCNARPALKVAMAKDASPQRASIDGFP